MNRSLNEKKVLKKLGITDFRHMTKDKIVEFASMLPHMDPEVAKKALDQFPEYASSIKELTGIYKDEINNLIASNEKSVGNVFDAYKLVLETLSEEIKRPDLSSEERESINERLIQVAAKIEEVDAENKKFLLKVLGTVSIAFGVGFGILYSALGGDLNIINSFHDKDSNDQFLS